MVLENDFHRTYKMQVQLKYTLYTIQKEACLYIIIIILYKSYLLV